jgi:hypothetical protein
MIVFVIFYGLIEIANAIYVYGKIKKEYFNLVATVFWGLMFVVIGTGNAFEFTGLIKNISYIMFGISWFPVMFTPCGIKVFRINNTTLFIRKVIFAIIGVSQFIITFS